MRRRLLAMLVSIALVASAAPQAAGEAAPSYLQIDTLIKTEMRGAHIPGISLGIVQDGQVTYLKGFGEASPGRPMLARTPMLLGSVSRWLTATAVMQLVQAGKIDLDEKVTRYLPWFRLADENAAGLITIRHLLNQTSGLTTEAGMTPLLDDGLQTLEGTIYDLRQVLPAGPPGEQVRDSHLNYMILGLVVQAVSGQPFGTYLRSNIFAPLQMNRSFTTEAAAVKEFMAEGYQLWYGIPIPSPLTYPSNSVPSTSIISTAEDLTRFLAAQVNGGRYGTASALSEQSVAYLRTAMGLSVVEIGGTTAFRQTGPMPSFHAELVLLPDRQAGFVLLANIQHPLIRLSMERLAVGITAILAGQPAPSPGWLRQNLLVPYAVAVLAAAAVLVWSLESLRRWRTRLQSSGRMARWLALGVVGLHLLVAVGLSFGVPWAVHGSWAQLQLFAPDTGRLLAAAVLASFIGAGGRIIIAYITLRKQGASWNDSQSSSHANTA
ncbi:MAG TPA: serine hydrolase domain-containing protein [Symbiobacteriaceae bacterium]|nr:serine hydrolase domain-containing protein [Symbiobacteriaceae bacterium]